jgi:hypothetical protein
MLARVLVWPSIVSGAALARVLVWPSIVSGAALGFYRGEHYNRYASYITQKSQLFNK